VCGLANAERTSTVAEHSVLDLIPHPLVRKELERFLMLFDRVSEAQLDAVFALVELSDARSQPASEPVFPGTGLRLVK
jgi:hypothetical protein